MTTLSPCRWRELRPDGLAYCTSLKYVLPPNRVAANFCGTCVYVDHAPAIVSVSRYTSGYRQQKIVVCTLYTPEISGYGQTTSEVLRAYARRHGYGVLVVTECLDPSRHPAWSKLLLVEQFLTAHPACEWLMWIDADAAITNPTIKLESLIDEDVDFIVGEDVAPSPINTGVFLIRNCPATLRLVRRAYAKTQFIHHCWWEQLAIAEALGEAGGDLRARVVPRESSIHFPESIGPTILSSISPGIRKSRD